MALQTAMIFAAGLGTRLKPFTNHHPKALAPVNGKSLLHHNVFYLKRFGIKKIIVNVHHFANQIVDEIANHKNWDIEILVSDETSEVLETGGGLLKAKNLILPCENFVVMNVDILTDLDIAKMYQQHLNEQSLATLAVTERQTSRYFLFDNQMKLSGWQNVQTNEVKGISSSEEITSLQLKPFAFSGVHIINSNIFNLITQQGKFSMVDVYLSLMKQQNLKGFNHSGGKLLDVGKPESIKKAEEMFT
jgi:NDP-sugar pyrophosphorylase family protein